MIEKIALNIVTQMEEKGLIGNSDKKFYEYALITLIERVVTVGSILIIGECYKRLLFISLFLLFFFFLRERTGGYHAEKFWHCYFMTNMTCIIVIKMADILAENLIFTYVILVISAILILGIGAVNHPNIAMNKKELKQTKSVARKNVMLEMIVIVMISGLNISKLYVSYLSMSIILCAFLLCTQLSQLIFPNKA